MIPKGNKKYNFHYGEVQGDDLRPQQDTKHTSCNEAESKRLPLQTKNTQKEENRRLGFIVSLYTAM